MPKRFVALGLLAVASCVGTPGQPPPAARDGLTALAHASVVDVERGRIVPDQTVLLAGDRIREVRAAGDEPATSRGARGVRTIDGRGLYVIPGLWDMHAHLLANFERQSALLLANGVTGIRQPDNSRLDTLRAVRQRVRVSGDPLPRLVAAGVLIDGDPPVRPAGSVVLRRVEDAPRVADSLLASGVDFFKVYARIERAPFFALAAEARRRGVILAGHIPNAVPPEEMSDAGARSIEHITEFALACSSREADMRAADRRRVVARLRRSSARADGHDSGRVRRGQVPPARRAPRARSDLRRPDAVPEPGARAAAAPERA